MIGEGESGRGRGRDGWCRLGRRVWFGRIAAGWLGFEAVTIFAQAPEPEKPVAAATPRDEEAELRGVEEKFREIGIESVRRLQSAHYQAVGDAPTAFMRLILEDCENLALDFLDHFRRQGFQVARPDRRLTLTVFRDDRSYGRYFRLPTMLQAAQRGLALPVGRYVSTTNVLYVFDWRSVPILPRSSHQNIQTIAHEGTHQLTFNTGLLNRKGDIPLAITEGLGTYGEPRKVSGRSEPGRLSINRLEDLAKIRRRRPWISVRELISDDTVLRDRDGDRLMLAYAESWLLVHYLMKEPAALPGFRNYLAAIAGRTKADHRLEDAGAHLGNLDALDRELQKYAIRLLHSI